MGGVSYLNSSHIRVIGVNLVWKEIFDNPKGEVVTMNRLMVVMLSVLLLVIAVPALAQEDSEEVAASEAEPCSAGSIIQRVDGSYAEFEATRSSDDSLTTFNDVQNFYDSIGAVLDECRNIVELAASGVVEVGSGTFDDPYAFDYFGDTGKGYLLKINGSIRPADQYKSRYDSNAPQGYEYVAILVSVQCVSPEESFCELSYSSFELTGDLGTVYEARYSSSTLDVKLRPGGEGSGLVFFLINSDDTNLLAMHSVGYYSDPVIFRGEPAPGQVVEGPGGNTVTITATTSINVRGGPGTSYSVVGSFQTGQQETAVGRNSAGTWVQMERGWVFAQLVRVDGTITSLPVTG